jgi:hypothetical protein
LEALLGRAGLDPQSTPTAPQTDGTGALASQPAPLPGRPLEIPGKGVGGLGTGAARLILHAPEEVEQVAATLPVNEVDPALVDPNPWQPRSVVDDGALAELTASLGEHGLVQPIVVRARGDRYQLIAGQRRLAAARRLGWAKLPVRVLDVDDRTAITMGIAGTGIAVPLEAAKIQKGERVLILGATGTLGQIGLQLARNAGAGQVAQHGGSQGLSGIQNQKGDAQHQCCCPSQTVEPLLHAAFYHGEGAAGAALSAISF